MRWVFINAYFPPEIGSASFLFFELGKKLVERGHQVTVLTGFPSYNVDVRALPDKYRKPLVLKEHIEGLEVIRVRTVNLPRYVPIARGIEQFLTAFVLFMSGLFLGRKHFGRILVYSPPLPLGLASFFLGKIKRVPVIFNVQDLFPQSAIDLGILTNRFLIRMFERLEKFIYKRSDIVTVHSEGNRDHVLSKGVAPCRVVIVPNWIDTDLITPQERDNEFRREFDLEGKFIVSFAGVIGYSQDLDTVIEAASLIKEKNITFLIVGEGVEKRRLQDKTREKGLKNIIFLPMQPKSTYVKLLAASDICLVNLHKEVKTPVVPSKLLSIMAAGRPVAASLPSGGDAPAIIEDSGCGICVEASDSAGLAGAISTLFSDGAFREACGRKGRDYAENNFSLGKCAKIYEELAE